MNLNFAVLFLVAFVPLILGMVYYNMSVMGKAWLESAGIQMPSEKPSMGQMMKIFVPVYFMSLLFAFVLLSLCVHQMGAFGMIGGNEATALPSFQAFMTDYSTAFRTFKHGAFHGGLYGFMLSLFFVGTPALFEMRGWKYIMIHTGFNTLCGLIMGGLICMFV